MDRIVTGGTRLTLSGGIMFSELLQTSHLTQALIQYLSRERSATDLEEWLVGNMQDILESGDHKAIEIGNTVDGLMVEMNERLINEAQFRKSVYELLVEKGLPSVFNSSASSNTVIPTEPLILSSTVLLRVRHSFSPAAADK
jgi:hypothetical protein